MGFFSLVCSLTMSRTGFAKAAAAAQAREIAALNEKLAAAGRAAETNTEARAAATKAAAQVTELQTQMEPVVVMV